jgi:TPR repeat protein
MDDGQARIARIARFRVARGMPAGDFGDWAGNATWRSGSMPRLLLTAATGILLLGVVAAQASPFEDGMAAYKRGDFTDAVKQFREGAEQGDVHAQTALGNLYGSGNGVRQNYSEATRWYRLAAVAGYAAAQNTLGFQYAAGHGVPRNFIRAYMWFDIAFTSGEPLCSRNRDSVARQMTPQQIAEAQKWARECQERDLKGCD